MWENEEEKRKRICSIEAKKNIHKEKKQREPSQTRNKEKKRERKKTDIYLELISLSL